MWWGRNLPFSRSNMTSYLRLSCDSWSRISSQRRRRAKLWHLPWPKGPVNDPLASPVVASPVLVGGGAPASHKAPPVYVSGVKNAYIAGLDSRQVGRQACGPEEGRDPDTGAQDCWRLPGQYWDPAIPRCGRGCELSQFLPPRGSMHAPTVEKVGQTHTQSWDKFL